MLAGGGDGNVAKWIQIGPRKTFMTIRETFNAPNLKGEGYYHEDHKAGGCFQPFALVEEVTVAEPWGTDPGWDQHYAKRLTL